MNTKEKRNRRQRTLRTLCALVLLWALIFGNASAQVYFDKPPAGWGTGEILEWTVFDVDEGDAMLLSCAGESMLIDGGMLDFGETLKQALADRGVSHVKTMLNTHYHDDHIDGLYYLLTQGFTAEEYLHAYSDVAIARNERGKRTVEAAKQNSIAVCRVRSGDKLTLGTAEIQVFQCTEYENTNARSLMLKVTFGESSLLLCADIIGKTQHYFLKKLSAETLKSDLIKLPHHAVSPTVKEFLDAVSPEAAVATNRYQRIEKRSANQLKARELTTLFSGDGIVCAVTDGRDWYMYQMPEDSL